MRIHQEYSPAIPIHPGEILQEELDARGWTQKGFAEQIGRPPQLINNIVNGRAGISAETALDFSDAFGTSAQFWMNLDSNYRLAMARKKRTERKAS
ncbi:MAG TPA: HigA family addiction module antitoxin [Armatimonadota bacterium]|nr:HigA family addiction module antitoxin [Armatimonadota bacterium]HOS43320.1 HigA family addiction module antitoxin [Armatimonadota bacterium]